MIISLIVAVARNGVIGKHNGTMPWYLPADLKRFRKITWGKPIIMGRKTYESIGRALPGRKNIVITRAQGYTAKGCIVVNSPEKAIEAARGSEEVLVIGGGEVYREFLPRVQRMYLTLIHADFDGDVYFPRYNPNEWQEKERQDFQADAKNPYSYSFIVLERL